MPFEKGRTKTGGKAKGQNQGFANKVRDALQKIAEDYVTGNGVKDLKADLASMRPIDRATIQERYLKYCLPTMGTVSVTAQNDDGSPTEIIVTYHSKTQAEKDADNDDDELDYSEPVE